VSLDCDGPTQGSVRPSSIRVEVDRSGVEAGGRRRLSYAAVEGASRRRGGVEGTRGGRGGGSRRCRGGRSRGRERRRGRRRSEAARWTIGGRRQSREEGGMEEEGPGFKYPKPLAPGDNFNRYLRAP